MSNIASLIFDLGVILIVAGIVTVLFKKLKQPVVLGYIVAGILAGPHFQWFPSVSNTESIQIWSNLGIIFLLFALGLEFSFKKLFKIGGTAIFAAITIVIGMMTLGYSVGLILGWGHINSLFLGGMLAMSSTTIVFKALDDMGLREQKFASIVFGILVIEDLFAVLLMVLLSTVAVSKEVEGMELLNSVLKLVIFLLFSFIIGIYIIPSFLKKFRSYLNDETLLITSIGLCLGMVIIATQAGFSSALGAFLMGSILAETIEAERIEQLLQPVKNLFGAIFFVSVGMLIDPIILWEYKFPILIITGIVLLGQLFFASSGILLSGQPLKIAIQSGCSLTQIGEFAFIIAGLGTSLHVTGDFLYPIVVAVSVITTFLTPYMIQLSEPIYNVADQIIPLPWRKFLERYSSGANTIKQKSTWKKLLRSLLRIVGTYTAVTVVLIFSWLQFAVPFIHRELPGIKGDIISLILIFVLIAPLLRAIIMKKNHSAEFQQLWNDSKYNRGPLVSLIIVRILLCMALIMFPVGKIINAATGLLVFIAMAFIIFIIFSKRLKKQSILMERHFFNNLSAREMEQMKSTAINQSFVNHMLERDLHLADFTVKQNSPFIGQMLKELNFRKKYNINVVTIIRGNQRINIPGGNERIYPFDKLIIAGVDNDIETFRKYIDQENKISENLVVPSREINIEQFIIDNDSKLIGRTILESGIRDQAACLVVGIERGNTSIKNPPPSTIFQQGDIVWIVGEHNQIIRLSEGDPV